MKCPICETVIEVPDPTREGTRITCPTCFAQLGIFKHKSEHILACAICKEAVFDPDKCADCERRREKKKIIEEGRL
jgi:primosomal protein N'